MASEIVPVIIYILCGILVGYFITERIYAVYVKVLKEENEALMTLLNQMDVELAEADELLDIVYKDVMANLDKPEETFPPE